MTEIEFKQYLKEFREYRWTEDEMVQKAKQLSSASNGAKPLVSGALPPVIEIEFGSHLYAKIDLQDGVKVLNVMNGWGDKVDLDLVNVKAAMTE